jgi:hypothetical protein
MKIGKSNLYIELDIELEIHSEIPRLTEALVGNMIILQSARTIARETPNHPVRQAAP